MSISRRMTSLPGAGIRDLAVLPFRERKSGSGSLSRRGLIPAPTAHKPVLWPGALAPGEAMRASYMHFPDRNEFYRIIVCAERGASPGTSERYPLAEAAALTELKTATNWKTAAPITNACQTAF